MQKIKLRPKQLASLNQILTQKQQLTNAFQELNKNESLLLELILEENNITQGVTNVKIDQNELNFDLVEEAKSKKKAKPEKSE